MRKVLPICCLVMALYGLAYAQLPAEINGVGAEILQGPQTGGMCGADWTPGQDNLKV